MTIGTGSRSTTFKLHPHRSGKTGTKIEAGGGGDFNTISPAFREELRSTKYPNRAGGNLGFLSVISVG